MPDSNPVISQITLPSNTTYDIKDTWARDQIETITGAAALKFCGVSTTPLTDGGTENPTIDGSPVTTKKLGEIYFYGSSEFIWGDDNKWHELGNLTNLGAMAYANTASTSYQPAGTITSPTFSGATMTLTTSIGIITGGTITVDHYESEYWPVLASTTDYGSAATYQPAGTVGSATFTGTTATVSMSTKYTPAGSVGAPTFTGTTSTISMSTSYRPAGTVGSATFTGTTTDIEMEASYQPAGNIGFTTTAKYLTVDLVSTAAAGRPHGSYQPAGSITAPTVSLATAGTTTSIKNPTSRNVTSAVTTAAPGATAPAHAITYVSVTSEVLSLYQIGYSTTSSISTSNVTVKTGDASYSAGTPTFTGTTVYTVTDSFDLPTAATFTGTTSTISMSTSYQPAGTNSTASFSGTTATISMSTDYQPEGTNSTATFSGTQATISMSTTYQPAGTNSTATFTGTTVYMRAGHDDAWPVYDIDFDTQVTNITVEGTPVGTITAPTFTGTTTTIVVSPTSTATP